MRHTAEHALVDLMDGHDAAQRGAVGGSASVSGGAGLAGSADGDDGDGMPVDRERTAAAAGRVLDAAAVVEGSTLDRRGSSCARRRLVVDLAIVLSRA